MTKESIKEVFFDRTACTQDEAFNFLYRMNVTHDQLVAAVGEENAQEYFVWVYYSREAA